MEDVFAQPAAAMQDHRHVGGRYQFFHVIVANAGRGVIEAVGRADGRGVAVDAGAADELDVFLDGYRVNLLVAADVILHARDRHDFTLDAGPIAGGELGDAARDPKFSS